MYGLKPVPFTAKPVPFTLKSVSFKLAHCRMVIAFDKGMGG
jgi:hypothetical protein